MRRHRLDRHSSGAVALELILALPALIIALLAVVEIGALMGNLQVVATASREGARLAARSGSLNAATATSIRTAVNNRLQAAGLGSGASAGVTLQHNVGGATVNLTNGSCSLPNDASLPSRSVRVRVCVPYERLAPNLLSTFGFTLVGKTAIKDATFDYEIP